MKKIHCNRHGEKYHGDKCIDDTHEKIRNGHDIKWINRVNLGHLWPPVSIRINNYLKWLKLKCDTLLESSAQALLISTQTRPKVY